MEAEVSKNILNKNMYNIFNLNIFKISDLYEKDIIGIGGFGTIFKANYLNNTLAIKTMNVDNPNSLAKELLAMKYLTHPNIPALYSITESHHSETVGIVYEYINGDTLINYIHNNKLNEIEYFFT
jgi:serine/threonine protein kinase